MDLAMGVNDGVACCFFPEAWIPSLVYRGGLLALDAGFPSLYRGGLFVAAGFAEYGLGCDRAVLVVAAAVAVVDGADMI